MNGSSRTGAELAELALAEGSHVHMIVRSAKRVSRTLTEPKPSPKLHIHELPNIFSPDALRPILAEADFLVLTFVPPPSQPLTPHALNQDGAIAAVAAIRAGTPAGQSPRTKVVLLSAIGLHPGAGNTFPERMAEKVMDTVLPYQSKDLRRATAYLRQQEAWGLQWCAMLPGQILESKEPESARVRRHDVRLDARPTPAANRITYGRLGGSFLQLFESWGQFRNGYAVPAPTGNPTLRGSTDVVPVLWANTKSWAKRATWWTVLVIVGWQVGTRYGDFGANARLRDLTAGLRS